MLSSINFLAIAWLPAPPHWRERRLILLLYFTTWKENDGSVAEETVKRTQGGWGEEESRAERKREEKTIDQMKGNVRRWRTKTWDRGITVMEVKRRRRWWQYEGRRGVKTGKSTEINREEEEVKEAPVSFISPHLIFIFLKTHSIIHSLHMWCFQ